MPRSRKLHVPDSVFRVRPRTVAGIASYWLRLLGALLLMTIDTVVWLANCFAFAGPMLMSAVYEFVLDRKVLEFLAPPGDDGHDGACCGVGGGGGGGGGDNDGGDGDVDGKGDGEGDGGGDSRFGSFWNKFIKRRDPPRRPRITDRLRAQLLLAVVVGNIRMAKLEKPDAADSMASLESGSAERRDSNGSVAPKVVHNSVWKTVMAMVDEHEALRDSGNSSNNVVTLPIKLKALLNSQARCGSLQSSKLDEY